jgi:hypothetical protein
MSSTKVWKLIIMFLVDHKPWRSTFFSVWSSPEKALLQLEEVLKSHGLIDDGCGGQCRRFRTIIDKDGRLTLDNYKDMLTDDLYFNIEESCVDPKEEEEEE